MKRWWLLLLLVVSPVLADEAPARFVWAGFVVDQGHLSFSLQDRETASSGWFRLGEQVGGFTVKAYDAQRGSLTLARAAETVELSLGQGAAQPADGSADRIKELETELERARQQLDEMRTLVASLPQEALTAAGLCRLQPGDTGAKIARQNNVSIPDLAAWNPGLDFKRLRVGQLIRTRAPDTPPQPVGPPRAP